MPLIRGRNARLGVGDGLRNFGRNSLNRVELLDSSDYEDIDDPLNEGFYLENNEEIGIFQQVIDTLLCYLELCVFLAQDLPIIGCFAEIISDRIFSDESGNFEADNDYDDYDWDDEGIDLETDQRIDRIHKICGAVRKFLFEILILTLVNILWISLTIYVYSKMS